MSLDPHLEILNPGTSPTLPGLPDCTTAYKLSQGKKLGWGFPGGSAVKNPPAMQETQVQSLGRDDLLKKEMQPTPVFLPGESHGQRRLRLPYTPWGHKESDMTERLNNNKETASSEGAIPVASCLSVLLCPAVEGLGKHHFICLSYCCYCCFRWKRVFDPCYSISAGGGSLFLYKF